MERTCCIIVLENLTIRPPGDKHGGLRSARSESSVTEREGSAVPSPRPAISRDGNSEDSVLTDWSTRSVCDDGERRRPPCPSGGAPGGAATEAVATLGGNGGGPRSGAS